MSHCKNSLAAQVLDGMLDISAWVALLCPAPYTRFALLFRTFVFFVAVCSPWTYLQMEENA